MGRLRPPDATDTGDRHPRPAQHQRRRADGPLCQHTRRHGEAGTGRRQHAEAGRRSGRGQPSAEVTPPSGRCPSAEIHPAAQRKLLAPARIPHRPAGNKPLIYAP